MKLSDIVIGYKALTILAEAKLPAKTAFKLAKILKAWTSEAESYEKARVNTMQRLGTISEDGTQYTFEGENLVLWQKEHEELGATEVADSPKIKLEELGDIEIEASVLAALEGLILEE